MTLRKFLVPEAIPIVGAVSAGLTYSFFYSKHLLTRHTDITLNKEHPQQFREESFERFVTGERIKNFAKDNKIFHP